MEEYEGVGTPSEAVAEVEEDEVVKRSLSALAAVADPTEKLDCAVGAF